MIRNLILFIFVGLSLNSVAYALDDANLLSSRLQKILSEKIQNAEIRIPSLEKLVKTPEVSAISTLSSVRLSEDRPNGIAVFELNSTDGASTKIQTPYQAWVKIPVAVHRIYPNTRLKKEDFRVDSVNVATGPAREYRGVLVYDIANIDRMETRQTILEGQFVVSNAVQKQPDLRKGETVKLELISGDLVLSTSAMVEENGSVGDKVHVLTLKTKKDLLGVIREDRTIEVRL